MKIRPRKEDAQIEAAISFMVEKINEYNTNPKPLILHSLRIGLRLYQKGESTKVVIAGILHDLLEDTKCTESEIEATFGTEMLRFVRVFNYDEPEVDYKTRWTQAIAAMQAIGRDAAIIKLVDIHDNLHYLQFAQDGKEIKEGLIWRHELVRDSFAELLQDDEDYQTYVRDLEEKKKEVA